MPKVSVVLPVYNAEETLDEAVRSIRKQSYEDWELLLVDDGSTDESPYRAQDWAGRDDRIHVLHQPHQGLVPALNAGLEAARGSLIARMDADDISLPRRLEKQVELLDNRPHLGLVSCLVKHGGKKDDQSGYARYVNWINKLVDPDDISLNRFVESPLAHPSVMFRRKVVDHYGGYCNGPFPEDYELWLRWLEQGVDMAKVTEPLLWWRDLPERLSRTNKRYDVRAFYAVKARYLGRWLKQHNPHHPEVTVWGAGRITRKRAGMLEDHGVKIGRYVDVDDEKIGRKIHGLPVIGPADLPEAGQYFVLSYVGSHGARQKIFNFLVERGYQPGLDFLLAA